MGGRAKRGHLCLTSAEILERPAHPLHETRIAGRLRSPSRDLDLHPDGKRFVVAGSEGEAAQRLDKVVFVFNFFDELRRIAPSKTRD